MNRTNIFLNLGQEKFVEIFVKSGADVNSKAYNGNTPLYEAASAGNFKTFPGQFVNQFQNLTRIIFFQARKESRKF